MLLKTKYREINITDQNKMARTVVLEVLNTIALLNS